MDVPDETERHEPFECGDRAGNGLWREVLGYFLEKRLAVLLWSTGESVEESACDSRGEWDVPNEGSCRRHGCLLLEWNEGR